MKSIIKFLSTYGLSRSIAIDDCMIVLRSINMRSRMSFSMGPMSFENSSSNMLFMMLTHSFT